MMQIPFSLPLIDDAVVQEVNDCLTNTGWLTSGPKVLELEAEIRALTGAPQAICVNSWTSGAMLMLRWFGVGPGDEVIIPAYTYAATALCALNIGARVVMVDVRDDFNIDPQKIGAAITTRTKAIIPVDIGGWPADYQTIYEILKQHEIASRFQPETPEQEKLGRILVLADAAHSIGAFYRNQSAGTLADASVFSFHSVKNITTAEGGAVCLNLPAPFDPAAEYRFLKAFALNGQTKSAFEKNQPGAWRYDIVAQGLKANMPDICAAVGLAQIRRYRETLLPDRLRIFEHYQQAFDDVPGLVLPDKSNNEGSRTSAHLCMLRFAQFNENQRDECIVRLANEGISTNVHYIPLPMLTLFKQLGYRMEEYPKAYINYAGEISLPLYNGLTEEQCSYITQSIKKLLA